ncbi:hypothetical protein Anas_14738 [Armadillidium nasatum]|uniref:Uncharacterized protein n=1 Tax=Armadillidium nasatum TaxID=96803 RepID=A0A5N5SZS2_9CRUS|nr:hypothetical protein Anas_14738 [Armadillidium nasatum]
MPSYPSSYQYCMPKSFINPHDYSFSYTQYDSDDADTEASITVRDFINERKKRRDISFQVTSAEESRCLYNPFGESILSQDSFWFMVKSLQEFRCCVTLQTYFIFKTQNYQITDISSVSDIGDLPPSYTIEGEMLLKRRIVRTTDDTGETVIEESERLMVETPVHRPLTRSRGKVTEHEHKTEKWNRSPRQKYINLLVVGSSEVRMFIEGRELLRREYGVDVRVEYRSGCTLDYCLDQIKRQMKPTTHLIIVWALTPYGWRRTSIRTRGKPDTTIFRPATFFSLQDIPRHMNQIMSNPRHQRICTPLIKPGLFVAWGEKYRNFLKDHVDYNPERMRKHSVNLYHQFTSLYQDVYYWEGKHLIYGNSALNCYIKKRPDAVHHKRRGVEHVNYLQGVTDILNSELLPDGLHGNRLFFKYYWKRNKSILKSIREINNIPPPPETPVTPSRKPLLGDAPTVSLQTIDANRRNVEHDEVPDHVSQILYHFTDLNQPSTSREGLSSQGLFIPPTREGNITSPDTHTQCITQMPSYPSSYQYCMPKSFINPHDYSFSYTQYDSDDADTEASITVRDFINERKRRRNSNSGELIKDLDKIIKNAKKEQEILKRRNQI